MGVVVIEADVGRVVADPSSELRDDFESDRHGDRYAMNDPGCAVSARAGS